jgi:transcriptional regulator with XRE-family HTH domain
VSLLDMDFPALVGRNVRRLRLAADLSQEELAHRAAMNRTYLSDIERGIRNPSLLMLLELATVLGVHPAVLLVNEEDSEAVSSIVGSAEIKTVRS